MTTTDTPTKPATIHVILDQTPGRHPVLDPAELRWWLPVLGPTATALLTEFALACDPTNLAGTPLDIEELGHRIGHVVPSKVWRALARLERFHVAEFASPSVVSVRSELPGLGAGYRRHLTASQLTAYTARPSIAGDPQ